MAIMDRGYVGMADARLVIPLGGREDCRRLFAMSNQPLLARLPCVP